MNCQQICKISRKKTLNRSENIPKSFRGANLKKHPVDRARTLKNSVPLKSKMAAPVEIEILGNVSISGFLRR